MPDDTPPAAETVPEPEQAADDGLLPSPPTPETGLRPPAAPSGEPSDDGGWVQV